MGIANITFGALEALAKKTQWTKESAIKELVETIKSNLRSN